MSVVLEPRVGRVRAQPQVRRRTTITSAALAGWISLVWFTHTWGARVVRGDQRTRIFAAPLAGRFDVRLGGWRILPILLVGGAAVAFGPRLGRSLSWRGLLVTGVAIAGAWAVSLAFVDGWRAITAPLTTRWDYLVDLPRAAGPGVFLRGFASNLGTFSTHVRAHPPGMLLILRGLQALGVRGAGTEAALIVVGGAATVPAAMVAARELAGERAARASWIFLAVAPAALWVATSADALFAGVAAWGVALVVVATGRSGRRSDVTAAAGGLLLAAAAFLSYGLVLVWLVPIAVAVRRRRMRPLVIAAAATAVIALAFGAAGFWWPSGLAAARVQYFHGAARFRPQGYFWIGNLGAFALALGPAAAVGVARLRDGRIWLLVGAALLAVALADLSGMSKGEVERIWLPFVPWILVATAAFDEASPNGWLALQAAAAVAIQLVVRSPW